MTTKEEILKEWMPDNAMIIAEFISDDGNQTDMVVRHRPAKGTVRYEVFRIFGMDKNSQHLSIDESDRTADELIRILFEELKT